STTSTNMQTTIRNSILYATNITLVLFQFSAFTAQAQAVTYPNGLTTCDRTGAAGLSSSVGNFGPQGGPYVPVVDYTVELNTATLVYKECVLREIVDQ